MEPFDPFRTAIARRLEIRRREVQDAVWGRLQGLHEEEREDAFPFAHGLRTAVTVAIDFALEALRRPEDKPPSTPPVLLDEARLAAREAVTLEAILRRYVAGYGVFCDYLIQEAEKEELLRSGFLQRLLAGQLRLLDRL
ncbi:MAG TPA: hypothetical protein VN732_08700, partial [Solirubrobacterales bacterium]|nr:hypothetical protein [Solirubrobacterales bacterium]